MNSLTAITLAVDAMGGDSGPDIAVPACVRALSSIPDCYFVLFGNAKDIELYLTGISDTQRQRVSIVATEQIIGMDEKPAAALRKKKQSSLYRAIEYLNEGAAQACVSAGSTGAMLAIGSHLLKLFNGIDRPAICATVPTRQGQCFLLDVGANISVQPRHLHQFAMMGSVLASTLLSLEKPRVGLLNIGVEESKGNDLIRSAAHLLEADNALNYVGFVEPDQIFFDYADVVVCDGFVGNIALKSAEGAVRLIKDKLQSTIHSKNLFRRLTSTLLHTLFPHMNPARYNAASFLGLKKTLVKSHGGANVEAFCHALEVAHFEARTQLPLLIKEKIEKNV